MPKLKQKKPLDPVEQTIADALEGIPYTIEGDAEHPPGNLDFMYPHGAYS